MLTSDEESRVGTPAQDAVTGDGHWLLGAVDGLMSMPGISRVLALVCDETGKACHTVSSWPVADLKALSGEIACYAFPLLSNHQMARIEPLSALSSAVPESLSAELNIERCLLVTLPGAGDMHYTFAVEYSADADALDTTALESELLAQICLALSVAAVDTADFSAVSRAKNEWEAAVDGLPQLVCLLDRDGLIMRANRAVEIWQLGNVQACRGQSLHSLLHPGCTRPDCELQLCIETLRDSLVTDLAVSEELHDESLGGDLRVSLGHAELDREAPPGHGVQASYAIIENITEQKRAEQLLHDYNRRLERAVQDKTDDLVALNQRLQEQVDAYQRGQQALRESEVRYEALVENSVTSIYLSDGERILYCNSKFAEVFGESRPAMAGKRLTKLFPGKDFGRFLSEIEALSRGYAEAEIEGRNHAGQLVMTRQSVSRAIIGGRPLLIGNLVDITRQKHVEAELRRLTSQRIAAQEGERARIASELHDGIGQSISAIKFSLENVLRDLPGDGTEAARARLQRTIERARESIEEVRRISMDLRPSTLDHLGLVATIGWFCREFGQLFPNTDVIKLIELEESQVPDFLKLDVFRLMQEAMNNAAKYAEADTIAVTLRVEQGGILLNVVDDGRGFDVRQVLGSSHTFGLRGMRERAECAGGNFEVDSGQQGTRIRVHWPLGEELVG